MPNGAGNSYDWIGFDPRGVGASQPSLSCIPDYFGYNRPYYVPVTRALERTWLARSKSYADACEANAAALLPHMKTTDSARDMDSIRKALGARQINYYGFSYGTYDKVINIWFGWVARYDEVYHLGATGRRCDGPSTRRSGAFCGARRAA